MQVTISQFKIPDWRLQTTNLELRVIPNETFIADDGGSGVLLEAGGIYRKVAVSVATETLNGYSSPVLTIPSFTLFSTLDAVVNRGSTYRAAIYNSSTGKLVKELSGYSSFALRAISQTSWTDIAFDNTVIPFINRPNFDQELKAYVDFAYLNKTSGGFVAGDVTSTVAGSPPTNNSLVNKSYVTSQQGIIPSAEIADFPSTGNYLGRLYKAEDGTRDLYQWNGDEYVPVNGGRYLATNFGIVNDGLSATPTDNLAVWEAMIESVPDTGAIIEFPPGDYYFSEALVTDKTVFVVGAGGAFTPDGEPIAGTNIIVASGQSGFKALTGARKVSLEKISFSTKNGHSGFTVGDGVYSEVPIVLRDVYIQSFGRDGVYLEGIIGTNSDFSLLEKVDVWGVKRDSFHYNGGGDTNIITTRNCNSTYAGRHGFYSGGNSNIYDACHAAFSAIVTVGGKDYYENGISNKWIIPYSESGSGSEYFYIANAASYCDIEVTLFGEPEIQYQSVGASLAGHRVKTSRGVNRLVLEDAQQTPNSHTYEWRTAYLNVPNALNLIAIDGLGNSSIPYEYRPATTEHRFLGNVSLASFASVSSGSLVSSSGALSVAKHNLTATVAPTSTNNFSQGYNITSRWYDTVAGSLYECVGDGVWFQF